MKFSLLKNSCFSRFVFSFLFVFVFAVAGCCVPASAATYDVNDVYNLLNNTTNTYLNTIKNSSGNIDSHVSTMNTNVSNIYSKLNTYLPSLTTISNHIQGLEQKVDYISNVGFESGGVVFSAVTSTASNVDSIRSGLSSSLPSLLADVNQLKEVLASDEDLAMRQGVASRVDQVNDDFFDSSSDSSASLSDYGNVASGLSSFRSNFSTGVSPSRLFDSIFSASDDNYGWYSNETSDALDTSTASRQNAVRKSRSKSFESDTPLLDSYYMDVYSALLGGEE